MIPKIYVGPEKIKEVSSSKPKAKPATLGVQ